MRYTCNVTDDPYNAKIKRETRKIMEEDLRLFFFFIETVPNSLSLLIKQISPKIIPRYNFFQSFEFV